MEGLEGGRGWRGREVEKKKTHGSKKDCILYSLAREVEIQRSCKSYYLSTKGDNRVYF